jgi:hypothetical protein
MSTPFYVGDLDYNGQDPLESAPWDGIGLDKFYLGRWDQWMVELPQPNTYLPSPSGGEIEKGLANGGSSVIRNASKMRRYTLGWNTLIGRDKQLIEAFSNRVIFGSPSASACPWVFVPPEDSNRLTLGQSLCGAQRGVVDGWVSSVAPVYQPTVAPAVFPGGTMLWNSGAPNSVLRATWNPAALSTPDPTRSPVYLPPEPCGFIFWATCYGTLGVTSASVSARITGRYYDGTQEGSTFTGASVTVPTDNWFPVYVQLDPFDLPPQAQFVLPAVVSNDGHPIYISNPHFYYGDQPPDWAVGAGVPRVVWPVPLGDTPLIPSGPAAMQMVLAETISGAA